MRPPIILQTPIDPDLIDAFWRYDDALLNDDVPTMSALFEDSPHTVRVDGHRMLVGHEAITQFRSARKQPPTRQIFSAHARTISPDTVLVSAITQAPNRKDLRGYQTQVWQKQAGRWVVIAAHLTAPDSTAADPAAFDTTIWRCVGAPLVPATTAGPLSGVGIAVKDLFAVKGFAVGAGNPTWLAGAPIADRSADVITTLLDSGAHLTGIARTDEFAYSLDGVNDHYGTPPNWCNLGAIPGGSSSGSASAVAAGQAQLGLGTDTAGSIRVPASMQGLFGLRTTRAVISTSGMLPLAPSFDAVGLLATEPDVLSKAVDVLAPTTGPASVATSTVTIPSLTSMAAPDVRVGFEQTLSRLAAQGVLPPVTAVHIEPIVLESWIRAFRIVQGAEAWKQHGQWIVEHPHALSDSIAERFQTAARATEDQINAARFRLSEARSFLTNLTQGAYLALPTCPRGAPPRTASAQLRNVFRTEALRLTALASIAGLPAISIPLLKANEAEPVGLSITGSAHTELSLVSVAKASIQAKTSAK
jgi:Asp-tRNA(Asn)/Glu-tRNA(Gln) amidotransferase A subunit family amidase